VNLHASCVRADRYYPPVYDGPRGEMPDGEGPRGPGGPGPAPDDDSGTEKVDSDTDSTTDVRSNFPETWIWTESMTGCVIDITVVFFVIIMAVLNSSISGLVLSAVHWPNTNRLDTNRLWHAILFTNW